MIQDPIGEMLTIIRNAQKVKKKFVIVKYSNIKNKILKILKNEGYIKKITIISVNNIFVIYVLLKYYLGFPVIEKIGRISRPGLRIYKNYKSIYNKLNHLGIVIISTSRGVMTNKKAKKLNLGGELICYVV